MPEPEKNKADRETIEPVTTDSHPTLVANVEAGLAGLMVDDDEPVNAPTDSEPVAGDEAEQESELSDESKESDGGDRDDVAEEEAESEGDASDDKEETDEEESEAAANDAPALPASYRRSLVWAGWTPDEIDAGVAQNSDLMLQVAERVHAKRAQEAAEFGRLGRERLESERKTEGRDGETVSPAKKSDADTIPLLDVQALKDEHGEDPLIDKIVGPVNQMIGRLNDVLPTLNNGLDVINRSQADTMGQTVDQFFGQKHMASYEEFYGKSFQDADGAQLDNRDAVLQMADAILAGADQQGRELSVDEALDFAHQSVAAKFSSAAVRKDIVGQVRKRKESVTVRPSKTKQSQKSADPRTDLERKVAGSLSGIFTSD